MFRSRGPPGSPQRNGLKHKNTFSRFFSIKPMRYFLEGFPYSPSKILPLKRDPRLIKMIQGSIALFLVMREHRIVWVLIKFYYLFSRRWDVIRIGPSRIPCSRFRGRNSVFVARRLRSQSAHRAKRALRCSVSRWSPLRA